MSGAWLPIYEDLPRHPKTIHAALILEIPEAQVVGHLVCLWLWAINNASDGHLPRPAVIERLVGWYGERGALVTGLCDAGWLEEVEGVMTIHDWHDYAGRLLDKRAKDKVRKEEWRRVRHGQDADATRTPTGTARVNSDSDSDSEKDQKQYLSEFEANSDPQSANGNGKPKVGKTATDIWKHWLLVWPEHQRMTFTNDRRAKVEARLREGIGADVIRAAIERSRLEPWWNGEKDGEWKADLGSICGKGRTVEQLAFDSRSATQDPHDQRIGRLRQLRAQYGDEAVHAMCETEDLWGEVCRA